MVGQRELTYIAFTEIPKGFFWSTFIYTTNLQFPSSPVVLINSVGQKVWLGLFKGQASILG